ncbi:class I SAM-dependent methyltransferase [Nitriliruptor alkaliphilus]|uniref:class I SAM-dependent methyltransferase n=1 Tax=Nitriliruptor alkaliphilus TaxID=427918 RepID=UPI000696A081|nr:class I SAM-dependent methyltransferase [Nitriliruptor alkaliphilus]
MTEASYAERTRASYDRVAVDYADLLRDELAGKPLDRGLLATFGERVQSTGGGLVGDVGCGPGRITGFLDHLDLEAFGVDLSPAMITTARATYPHLSFRVGSMEALDISDGSLGGVVAWYSIIHTPPERLPEVFAEFHRVLRVDGQLLMAFQIGDEPVHLDHAYGHEVSLDVYRSRPERIRELLEQAGFVVDTTVHRAPMPPEKSRQAYLFGAKSGSR